MDLLSTTTLAERGAGAASADEDKDESKIRIARIGGRFLVFDVADVARLRRHHNLCAVLVGITPQAPNQCLFSGLPLELTADEVRWLVCDRRAAYIVDDRTAHLACLAQPAARRAYRASIDRQRAAVQAAVAVEVAERERRGAEARARRVAEQQGKGKKGKGKGKGKDKDDKKEKDSEDKREEKQVVITPAPANPAAPPLPSIRITPTTSEGLVNGEEADCDRGTVFVPAFFGGRPTPPAALRALLADRGYYTTPGLRFGGALSVYPGDPFRYHAHFVTMMPAAYAWDEPVALLDVVGTGRLATGVKKGLLLAGEVVPIGDGGDTNKVTQVRTFTLEWAAI